MILVVTHQPDTQPNSPIKIHMDKEAALFLACELVELKRAFKYATPAVSELHKKLMEVLA
jgi:hypothetical protein